jgi:class 3 adenylate cyclase
MAPLGNRARAELPDSSFAYVDSKGQRRLPIHDASHVRNALSRFEQVAFESDAARERARQRLLRAAQKYGIAPIGFFDGQLRKERRQGETLARAARVASLPRGRVTLLLADVEGSTTLARKLGDDFPSVLDSLWKTVRGAVRRAVGDEVDIRGDEYFAVFRQPMNALKAAIAIQRSTCQMTWPKNVECRVRIGLHTGQPTITDAAYVGIHVHTLARVCSAGHGGQILLSSAAQEALAGSIGPDIGVRELGRYMLAGLAAPEALYQVEADGLMSNFPRLRARLAPARIRAATAR